MKKKINNQLKDESKDKYILDSNVVLSEDSEEKSILDSNVESIENSEEKLIAESNEDLQDKLNVKPNEDFIDDLTFENFEEKLAELERECVKYKTQLRESFNNSYFLPMCYDEAIDGFNPITESIIYNYMLLGEVCRTSEETHPDYADTLAGGEEMVELIKNLTPEETEGKVLPTLSLLSCHWEYLGDIEKGGWY